MFDDLDATLTQVLHDAPAGELPQLRNADVSFMTPDRTFAPPNATVDLFLYEVRENRELRDGRPIVEHSGNGYTRRLPPLRADCSYIVTTWTPGQPGDAQVAAEHRLLGQALVWLSHFPTIPDVYLQGLLGSPDRIYPPPAMAAQVDPNQHAGDFWVAMGIAPRPAFYLTVTVEMELGGAISGPLVTTHVTEFVVDGAHDRPWIQIGGRVLAQGGDGLAGAVVDIVDLRLRTRSREEGRYSFPRVPPGTHTVRVVAEGFTPQTQPLVVPGGPDNYVVSLTPLP
jgi:Pvc16 N-terminal domain/Carboxypeptidase regulatory-like domain